MVFDTENRVLTNLYSDCKIAIFVFCRGVSTRFMDDIYIIIHVSWLNFRMNQDACIRNKDI